MTYLALLALFTQVELDNDIPCGLLAAVCFVESRWNTRAFNENDGGEDSVGVCQMQGPAANAVGYSRLDLHTPRKNVEAAALYLRKQFDRYKSWEKAVIAYNKGHATKNSNRYQRKVWTQWKKHSCY